MEWDRWDEYQRKETPMPTLFNYRVRITDRLGNKRYLARYNGRVSLVSRDETPLSLTYIVTDGPAFRDEAERVPDAKVLRDMLKRWLGPQDSYEIISFDEPLPEPKGIPAMDYVFPVDGGNVIVKVAEGGLSIRGRSSTGSDQLVIQPRVGNEVFVRLEGK